MNFLSGCILLCKYSANIHVTFNLTGSGNPTLIPNQGLTKWPLEVGLGSKAKPRHPSISVGISCLERFDNTLQTQSLKQNEPSFILNLPVFILNLKSFFNKSQQSSAL